MPASAPPTSQLPGVDITLTPSAGGGPREVSTALKILLGLTVISLAPALLIAVTSFTRIVIVLSMLRHALGMPETPPNTVLIDAGAVPDAVHHDAGGRAASTSEAYQPFMQGRIDADAALAKGDGAAARVHDAADARAGPGADGRGGAAGRRRERLEDVSVVQLMPAFMLSELKSAFQIGFVIFLPFLLIDLVVSSVLMSMGMFMVPPVMISLPIKVLMFVLIDGWNIVRALAGRQLPLSRPMLRDADDAAAALPSSACGSDFAEAPRRRRAQSADRALPAAGAHDRRHAVRAPRRRWRSSSWTTCSSPRSG